MEGDATGDRFRSRCPLLLRLRGLEVDLVVAGEVLVGALGEGRAGAFGGGVGFLRADIVDGRLVEFEVDKVFVGVMLRLRLFAVGGSNERFVLGDFFAGCVVLVSVFVAFSFEELVCRLELVVVLANLKVGIVEVLLCGILISLVVLFEFPLLLGGGGVLLRTALAGSLVLKIGEEVFRFQILLLERRVGRVSSILTSCGASCVCDVFAEFFMLLDICSAMDGVSFLLILKKRRRVQTCRIRTL